MLQRLSRAFLAAFLHGTCCLVAIPIMMTLFSAFGLVSADWWSAPIEMADLVLMLLIAGTVIVGLPTERILDWLFSVRLTPNEKPS